MTIRKELLDELIGELKNPEEFYGKSGLIAELTRAITERALEGELTHHLGYLKNSSAGNNSGNSRNGKTSKTVKGKNGELSIDVPPRKSGETVVLNPNLSGSVKADSMVSMRRS